MTRSFIAAITIAVATLLAGCNMMGLADASASGTPAASASPGVAMQTTIIALQTWLSVEQSKASGAGNTSRANMAGSLIGNLSSLRTEPNCANRLRLANTVSGGLQTQFPAYQTELGLGTNLATVLVSGFPGCQ